MNNVDEKAARSFEATNLKLVLKPSTIKHPDAGRAFAARDVVGHFCGTLIYGDIGSNSRLHKAYGSGILSVTSADYEKWAIRLPHKFIDAHSNKFEGFVVPAPFCIFRYINDPR